MADPKPGTCQKAYLHILFNKECKDKGPNSEANINRRAEVINEQVDNAVRGGEPVAAPPAAPPSPPSPPST